MKLQGSIWSHEIPSGSARMEIIEDPKNPTVDLIIVDDAADIVVIHLTMEWKDFIKLEAVMREIAEGRQ